ncbi:MAG: DNA glycosylase [Candidatus Fimimorpha sp.]
MIEKTISYMDLRRICYSGQCFRMEEIKQDTFQVIAFGRKLMITQCKDQFYFSCGEEEFDEIWYSYFDLDTDYEKIQNSVQKEDTYLTNVAKIGWGIRILRQDLWEMIITFIISQQNNIPRIRKCVQLLCQRYGEKKQDQTGELYYDFPTPEVLAEAKEDDLKACNLGYRSRYIKQTAISIVRKEIDLEQVRQMTHEQAKKELLQLYGVGKKVADCICLFALHHVEAFPIDTHIRQVLDREYPDGFPFERYENCAGILQQYMFYYEINRK